MGSPAFQDLAWTAHIFHQTPSSLLEIREWSVAREIDIAAAAYVHGEEVKQAVEREKRDREFWIRAFGGEISSTETGEEIALEEVMSRSALGSH